MNILRHSDADFAAQLARLAIPSSLFDTVIEDRTRAIVEAVKSRGDAALLEFTERFDGATLAVEQLAVTPPEFLDASLRADDSLRMAVKDASKNIEAFSRKSLRKKWSSRNSHGAKVGEKYDAFQRIGIYIPGGTAPLVSTALMTILLAKVAGCREIVVCTPCNREGKINPALLFAARTAGATEIFRAGGAQAIAAMAYGTGSIRRVQKIFGPGNSYVTAAKRLLFGQVSIDLLCGPSEVLVLADDSADVSCAVADMLAQAEHGSGDGRVWLITTSSKVVNAVQKEIVRQLPKLSARVNIQKTLDANGWLIQVKTLDHAIELANQLAPEHCEIMMRGAVKVADKILTAGAIFIGKYSPTVLGDYVAGPSHTLPTGGAGASFAGLTVDQFQRRTSIVEYDRAALKKALPAVAKFAEIEGLDAHGKSATMRKP